MSKARGLADLGNVYDDGALSNRNLIVNSAMQVAQRGTSVTGATSSGYSVVDRWSHNASGGTLDVSQEDFTLGQTDVPSQIKHFQRVSATTGANNAGIRQRVEDVQSVAQGQVTVSFYAKGTNPNGGDFELEVLQNFGSGGSSTVIVASESVVVTSAWQRFTFTLTVPSLSGKTVGAGSYFQVYLRQPTADNSTSAWTLDFTGVQLEVGDTATPFEHPRSYSDELARCQRYFIDPASATSLGTSAETFSSLNTGATVDSTASIYLLPVVLPVTMRADPTVTLGSGTLGVYTSLNTNSFGRRACNVSIAQNICPTGFVVKAQDNVDTAHCGIRGWWICDAEL